MIWFLYVIGIDSIGLGEQLVPQLIDREAGRVNVSGRCSRRLNQRIHFWEEGRKGGRKGGREGGRI